MGPTTYPPYLREKARSLRRERRLIIDQLAECLALPRTTIYYCVRDLPIPRTGPAVRVLSVVCRDTYFRARLEAWMECVKDDWLHSEPVGV